MRRPRHGEDLDPGKAWHVRVVEHEVPDLEGDRKGELIALVTTITDPRQATGGIRHDGPATIKLVNFSPLNHHMATTIPHTSFC